MSYDFHFRFEIGRRVILAVGSNPTLSALKIKGLWLLSVAIFSPRFFAPCPNTAFIRRNPTKKPAPGRIRERAVASVMG